jgi:hypothetical protein
VITVADDVPIECLVDACDREFIQIDDSRQRLTQIKQHLYQDHGDELSESEIVDLVEELPGLTDL